MPLLLIESSTERALVGLVEAGELLYHHELPFGFQHSRYLLSSIETGLRQLQIAVADLDAIVVGSGPGSYTGMRVAAMSAKMLSFAAQVPLIGISTLHTFGPALASDSFAVLIDAKIGGVYLAEGFSAPEIVPLNKVGSRLHNISSLVTPYAASLQAKFKDQYPDKMWHWEERSPDPLRMAFLAEKKLANRDYTTDGQLELLYMRKTQAEIEKEGKT